MELLGNMGVKIERPFEDIPRKWGCLSLQVLDNILMKTIYVFDDGSLNAPRTISVVIALVTYEWWWL
jgi:hypothetical protein